MAEQKPQTLQIFYKPQPGQPGYDANNPQAVYDTTGKLISLDQYKQATGQMEIPNDKIDWSAVQSGTPTGGFTSNPTFDPNNVPGLGSVWTQLNPAQQAFIQSAYGVVKGQYESGGTAVADQNTWNKALQIASTDPTIQATYGDAAKEGAQQLAFNIGQVTGNYTAAQAAQQATLYQQKQALDQQIAQAGQAYSGFAQKAKENLAASQNDIIQSSRSQLQQNVQNLGSQYEKQFGSASTPPITIGGYSYTPVGNVIGTNTQGQIGAETSLATNQGILPSATSSGTLSTTGK